MSPTNEPNRRDGSEAVGPAPRDGDVIGVPVQTDGDEDEPIDEELPAGQKALIFQPNYSPRAPFAIVSDVVRWAPRVEAVTDNLWSDYNTRIVRRLDSGAHVFLFVAHEADVGPYDESRGYVVDDDARRPLRPQVYRMGSEFTLFEDDPSLLTVNFVPLDEHEEDDVLAGQDWWRDGRAG